MAQLHHLPSGTTINRLDIQKVFSGLTQRDKLYAHHLSRAAWHGSRVILRQTSPEGDGILDFILELHKACHGQWQKLVEKCKVEREAVDSFLEFAGTFLSKLNNYCGEGDRKIVPTVSVESLRAMASISPQATSTLDSVLDRLLSPSPVTLNFSSSNYYPGIHNITNGEVAAIARVMEKHSMEPENTRVRKITTDGGLVYEIVQASAKTDAVLQEDLKGTATVLGDLDVAGETGLPPSAKIEVKRGDHAQEMSRICDSLLNASRYAATKEQSTFLMEYINSFTTGSLQAYRRAMKAWVMDKGPRVESIFGFVEPYRDPYGVRCEWRGVVSIADPDQTNKLGALVDGSERLIRMLPWAATGDNDGKGPFEKTEFQPPAFSVVHALAFCCSNVWEASNVPNYNDIRETLGFKNIVYSNRLSANDDQSRPCYYVHPSEVNKHKNCSHNIRFITTAVHELLGHGTGKLLAETAPGVYNFDNDNPPINPLTGRPVEKWYRYGKSWTSVFEKLAATVDECRASLVAYYLADDLELLKVFGHDADSKITADEIIYNTYLHIGVEGLNALQSFNVEEQIWGEPHAQGDFATLRYLLEHGQGAITVDCDEEAKTLYVRADRSKFNSGGKAALGDMLRCLHIWRCTADVEACRAFYEPLCEVNSEFEVWRQVVASKPKVPWKFVQANTFLQEDGEVELRTYDATNEGIIKSFVERDI